MAGALGASDIVLVKACGQPAGSPAKLRRTSSVDIGRLTSPNDMAQLPHSFHNQTAHKISTTEAAVILPAVCNGQRRALLKFRRQALIESFTLPLGRDHGIRLQIAIFRNTTLGSGAACRRY